MITITLVTVLVVGLNLGLFSPKPATIARLFFAVSVVGMLEASHWYFVLCNFLMILATAYAGFYQPFKGKQYATS